MAPYLFDCVPRMLSGLSLSVMVRSVSEVHLFSAFTSMYSNVSGSVRLVILGKLSAPSPTMNSKYMGNSTCVTRLARLVDQKSWSAEIPMTFIHSVAFKSSSHTL